MFTLGMMLVPSPEFTGPVDVVMGKQDLIFCGGDCSVPIDQSAAVIQTFYPAASQGSQHFLQPSSGHFIAAHYTARQGFDQMVNFVKANGFT